MSDAKVAAMLGGSYALAKEDQDERLEGKSRTWGNAPTREEARRNCAESIAYIIATRLRLSCPALPCPLTSSAVRHCCLDGDHANQPQALALHSNGDSYGRTSRRRLWEARLARQARARTKVVRHTSSNLQPHRIPARVNEEKASGRPDPPPCGARRGPRSPHGKPSTPSAPFPLLLWAWSASS